MVKTLATPVLRDLHIFILAATTQNLSTTAEEIGMTPAAISKSIKRLEKLFGAKMFERVGRGLALTMAGSVLYHRSKSVDDLVKLAHTEIADMSAASTGLVRLGASPAVIDTVVAPAVARLISDAATMKIELHGQISGRLLEELQAGALDMAMAAMPRKVAADLKFDKLGTIRSFIVARRDHPFSRRPFTLEDLSRQRWMVAPLDAEWISLVFTSVGLAVPEFSVRTDVSPTVFASLLASSDLLSVMDISLLSTKIATSLAVLPSPAPMREAQFGLFWRKEAFFSAAMKRCRIELKRAYRSRGEA